MPAGDSYHHWSSENSYPDLVRVRSGSSYVCPPECALLDYLVTIMDSSDSYRLYVSVLPRHCRLCLLPVNSLAISFVRP